MDQECPQRGLAGLAGLSMNGILERGSWTNVSTWQRFYNRQVESSAESYQNKVKLEVLKRTGGMGSSMIKGPRSQNTVFDLTDIL